MQIKFITDATNLLSDPAKVMSQESISNSNRNSEDKNEGNMVTKSASKEGVGEGADLLKMLPENGNRSIAASESIVQETVEDEILSVDTNGIINEGLLVLNAGSDIDRKSTRLNSSHRP